ncbi:MAG: ParB/RepB/Spo0J family partition protein [Pseudomonadota bacterium]
MAKNFAPRLAKKERKTLDLSEKLDRDLFKVSDERLLKGATLDEIHLEDITVKGQVRTKFNDESIKELAQNIQENGLIQPLVIHRNKEDSKYTLICGERRYRAMSSIELKKAPCFVLDNKTVEELMAIQFSENSSRENLHYIDQANGIYNYHQATNASERKIVAVLGISKSEVHRGLMIAKLPDEVKEAAKKFDMEKYVLVEFDAIEDEDNEEFKKEALKQICQGELVKCSQFKKLAKKWNYAPSGKKKSDSDGEELDTDALLKLMENKSKGLKIDNKTKQLLKSLMEKSQDLAVSE